MPGGLAARLTRRLAVVTDGAAAAAARHGGPVAIGGSSGRLERAQLGQAARRQAGRVKGLRR